MDAWRSLPRVCVIGALLGILLAGCGGSTVAPPPNGPDELARPAASLDSAAIAPASPKGEKPKREPIYDTETAGEELIAASLARAQREHKHVLIEWGDNSCDWCYRLHDVFMKDETVSPLLYEEFELALVDQGRNQGIMKPYCGDQHVNFPHLTVLDDAGQVLANQDIESLEEGAGHNPQAVAEFLRKWTSARLDAETLLADALQRAGAEDKRVLVHVGTPYCGWCKMLTKFLREHEAVFAVDYIDLKIDTLRMTHGKEVAVRYEPQGSSGIPWMVILDAAGQPLVNSVGHDGNIGYPLKPQEIDDFLKMLRETRQRLTDADLEIIANDLHAYRADFERRQRAQPDVATSSSGDQ
jgi:thioredoxin-related protein